MDVRLILTLYKAERIAEKIVDAEFTVHKVLGRGRHFNFIINSSFAPP